VTALGGEAEEVLPILEILPLQLLAHEVTIARGQDPYAPRAPAKVAEALTWAGSALR
jgi:glutamine---fructose-6-phosphate transaminase (isomerizing)